MAIKWRKVWRVVDFAGKCLLLGLVASLIWGAIFLTIPAITIESKPTPTATPRPLLGVIPFDRPIIFKNAAGGVVWTEAP